MTNQCNNLEKSVYQFWQIHVTTLTNPTILVNYSKLKRAETNPGTRPMIGLVSENLWFVISCKVFLWGKKIRVKKYFSWRSTSFWLCQLIAWYIDGNNGSNYSVLCSASKYCMLKLKKENSKGYILCKFLFLFRKRGCLTFVLLSSGCGRAGEESTKKSTQRQGQANPIIN